MVVACPRQLTCSSKTVGIFSQLLANSQQVMHSMATLINLTLALNMPGSLPELYLWTPCSCGGSAAASAASMLGVRW